MTRTALEAAREAAEFQRETAGTLPVETWSHKGTSDFVTEVDRESERRIVGRLLHAFPSHLVLAEEGSVNPSPERDIAVRSGSASAADREDADGDVIRWVIDPLDGTTNWLHGYPAWAVSIAAMDRLGLRVGVVVNGATGEEFVAVRGSGATRDGRAIHVSDLEDLRFSLIGTGFPFRRPELLSGYLRVLERVLVRASGVRRAGAAALDLCDVACGRLDGFWEHWLMSWDVAAGALIIREAGGTFGSLPVSVTDGSRALREAVDAACAICRTFFGQDPSMTPEVTGAAFFAGNGRIDRALAASIREALESA